MHYMPWTRVLQYDDDDDETISQYFGTFELPFTL